MGFVADAIESVAGAVVDVVGTVVETVVKNPLPVITAVIAPEVGLALGLSTPVSTAAISAVTAAAQGESPLEIIQTAAAGGFGSYVGGQVGTYAQDYAAVNIPSVSAEIAGKVAGGAAGGGTAGLIATGDPGKALQSAALGGATAGAVEAGKSLVSSVMPSGTSETTPGASGTPAGTNVQTYPQYGSGSAPSETASQIYPQYAGTPSVTSNVTMPSTTYQPTFWEGSVGTKLAAAGESVAASQARSGLADLFGLTPSSPTASSGSTITGQTQYSPGSQALAQALRVDPGATLGGGDQKAPQNVWNLASLRVKDETGG